MIFELPIIKQLVDTISDIASQPIFFLCLFIIIPIVLISSFICLALIFRKINSLEEKTVKMREISEDIRKGAKIYLKDQTKMLVITLAILFVPVAFTGVSYFDNPYIAFFITGAIFFLGAFSSLIAGYIGMQAATKANILVTEASIDKPEEGFKLAYYGGMITGILNISLFVLGIWSIVLLTNMNIYLMVSYGFGASVSSLFAQVGGGIYTKSADMGADLAGKYELDIGEDDPRNPAIIADLVGDNVGDCAGRGADLFESASSDAVGGMVLGLTMFLLVGNPIFVISNITLISLGLFSLFFTTLFLKIDLERPSRSIWRVFFAATFFNVIILITMNLLFFGPLGIYFFLSSLVGLLTVFLTIIFTTYYTRIEYKPTRKIADSSEMSPSVNLLSGLTTGFKSVFGPIAIFSVAIVAAYIFGVYAGNMYFEQLGQPTQNILGNDIDPKIFSIAFGIFGVNMASASSDVIISTILSFDTFGPIADNAAGIAEMGNSEAPENLRGNLDKLDAVGNTTKAVAKGFALVCGGFSSIVMFLTFLLSAHTLAGEIFSFIPDVELQNIFSYLDLYNPSIILGLILGTALSVLFTSLIFEAVRKGAMQMVEEVRCQFRDIPGLKDGHAKPDYNRCIDISAKTALRYLLQPVLIIIAIELATGILFGPMVMSAFLIGNLIGCLIMGLWQSVGGASFDNAKKAIEDGMLGGKGSFAHKASIIGDTVGDPLKDAAGPSMNILITTVNTLALTFLPVFMMTGWLWNLVPL
ncbi:MAG: K(+)-insensitive pyrophosphate-energized proton pump [Promethearchaeota archaeon]|nr:MAG: K(+)-insensitive pyrophosphate-energized proton pump [Candidatus Lokiarchaeota archaeon]